MDNEYFGVATTPMDNYLAHYGVRGMKWGVRKAIASGNKARLGRQYAKAQKKLAKLEKQASNSKKYARRAAALGAGAAVAGVAASRGTKLVGDVLGKTNVGLNRVGTALSKVKGNNMRAAKIRNFGSNLAQQTRNGGRISGNLVKTAQNVNAWGAKNSISEAARNAIRTSGAKGNLVGGAYRKLQGVSNNTIARIGAGAVGAGLAAGAARNAYKAATAQKRAAKFRSEMNKAFAGTQYANGGSRTSSKKRRRR